MVIVCKNVVGNCRKNFQGKTSNSVFPTHFDIFCNSDNLLQPTTNSKNKTTYDMLRQPKTCYDNLRHATTTYDILRQQKMSKRVGKTEFEVFPWKVLRQFPTTFLQRERQS